MSIDQPEATPKADEASQGASPTDGERDDPVASAHRPAFKLAGPYGHPFHPILVTIPIGAWVSAVIFDFAGQIRGDARTFAPGAFWLVVIGIVGALAAAVFGFMDMQTLKPGSKAHRTALIHMALNISVVVLFAITLPIRRQYVDHSNSRLFADHVTDPTPWSAIAISVVALLLLGASGWLGGKLSYRYGVRVADESDQAEGLVPPTT